MNHSNTNLKISGDEATRLYEVSTRRLLANKKLTLVVDLDMTIIHATVDPTVADWQKDETNPNHKAVKDVQVFQLMDEGPGSRVCSYYIKMRPGLKDFLEDISQKYELHVYTMGTRSYAQNVCKIVDPDEKIFGDRILSRDENGNLLKKNLRRLFPIDSKMVAIIDDRSDVWDWSPYLLRVTPFDFFVGTGDINGSFLSNRVDLVQSAKVPDAPEAILDDVDAEGELKEENGEVKVDPTSSPTIEEQLLAMAGSSNAAILEEQGHKQQEVLTAQLEDRPLLKKQELLDKQDEEASKEQAIENGSNLPIISAPRHNLLVDDDTELEFLQMHLERLHHAFFTEYERNLASAQGGRVAELRGDGRSKKRPTDDWSLVPDIKDIMPPMKLEVLQGVVICFTGVIPQNTDHQR
jgi:RNA polymerase II subunit A-like phosphatase